MANEAGSSSSNPAPCVIEEEVGEEFLYGAESGWVEALTSCDHLPSLCSDLAHIPPPDTACCECENPKENWLCLCCKNVFCSRFVNKHMLQHYQQSNHSLALSYSDLSVWCFSCDAYLDAQLIQELRPVHEVAYILKFGEAPPFR
ncbi:Histone deacetylase 6, partial [Cucurbita argyrosperma subsp. sororia]